MNELVKNEMVKNELVMDDNFQNDVVSKDFISELNQKNSEYCSVNAQTITEKMELANAIQNPTKRLAECINETIFIKDVYIQVVDVTNKDTGVIDTCPRIVLIGADGETYQAVSIGVFSAIKNLFKCLGTPAEWRETEELKNGLPLKVKQITKDKNKMLTFECDMSKIKK